MNGTLTGHGCDYVPDIFLFSVILFFGTFAVASALKKFKFTPYFSTKVIYHTYTLKTANEYIS